MVSEDKQFVGIARLCIHFLPLSTEILQPACLLLLSVNREVCEHSQGRYGLQAARNLSVEDNIRTKDLWNNPKMVKNIIRDL